MTDEPSEFQPERDAAVREHVRRLRSFCDPAFVGDFELFAQAYLNWLVDHGWRVIPPPPNWKTLRDQRPADPSQNEAVRELRKQMPRRGES